MANALSRRIYVGILCVLAVISACIIACHSTQRLTPLTPQQAEGQHLYQVRCAHCHEDNDLGLKPAPPQIHGVLTRQNLPSGIPASDDVVRNQVLVGKGKMPAFQGRFTEPQMQALLAYLHTSMPNPNFKPE